MVEDLKRIQIAEDAQTWTETYQQQLLNNQQTEIGLKTYPSILG